MTAPLLIDGHNDLAWAIRERHGLAPLDLEVPRPEFHTDLPRLRAGGVSAQFWSVFVPSELPETVAVVQTLEQIDLVHRLIRRNRVLTLATTADDIEGARVAGRIASLIGVEGGHSIGSSLSVLRVLHAMGARYLTLTHNDNTPWADSATDAAGVGGLSDFGREVVGELNRLGILVDLSHVADTTMRHALAVTHAPVIFSHSNARAVCDVPRNIPDDVLHLLALNGGVVMATFVPRFVTTRAEGSTIDDVVAQIEYLREVVGIAGVGIGGDFDGDPTVTVGLEDVSRYPVLFDALRARQWSEADLVALAGGNLLRALRDAESVARA